MAAPYRLLEKGRALLALSRDPLYSNAAALMASTGLSAATGFLFWMMAARLYPASAIGLATGLISAIRLVTSLADMGLGIGLVRFLSTFGSQKAIRTIQSALVTAGGTSLVSAIIFVLGIPLWSPSLLVLTSQPAVLVGTLGAMVFWAWSLCLDQVLMAYQRGGLVLVKHGVWNLFRLLFLFGFAFVGVEGEKGILFAFCGAATVSVLVAVCWLMPRAVPGYRLAVAWDWRLLGPLVPYSLANHATTLIWNLPGMMLPLLVLNILGASAQGHYYIAYTVASLLFALPVSTTNSLLAAGSQHMTGLYKTTRRALRLVLFLGLFAAVGMWVMGPYLLGMFGREYRVVALPVLRLVSVSVLPLGITSVFLTLRRIERKMAQALLVSLAVSMLILVLSVVWLRSWGLVGVGWAWLVSHCMVGAVTGLDLAVLVIPGITKQSGNQRCFWLQRAAFHQARLPTPGGQDDEG
jgi:O-antigen/teichoic acid export membrane protein